VFAKMDGEGGARGRESREEAKDGEHIVRRGRDVARGELTRFGLMVRKWLLVVACRVL
jgi:hypothetical protein